MESKKVRVLIKITGQGFNQKAVAQTLIQERSIDLVLIIVVLIQINHLTQIGR